MVMDIIIVLVLAYLLCRWVWKRSEAVESPDLIPFSEAVMCETCKRISGTTHDTCPGCGSTTIWNLSKVLGWVPIEGTTKLVEEFDIDGAVESLVEEMAKRA